MNAIISVWFLVAALWALNGTNTQARLSRQRLFEDEDPLVAAAGRLWRPFRWAVRPSRRRRHEAAEAAVRRDSVRWRRYQRLCAELSAWNALESSVALAAGATLLTILAPLFD